MDDPSKRNSPDNKRINIHEDHEVRHWTGVLNVSRNELVAAVEKVGTSADAVWEYFDTQRHRRNG